LIIARTRHGASFVFSVGRRASLQRAKTWLGTQIQTVATAIACAFHALEALGSLFDCGFGIGARAIDVPARQHRLKRIILAGTGF
jgi:hypothetical protein